VEVECTKDCPKMAICGGCRRCLWGRECGLWPRFKYI